MERNLQEKVAEAKTEFELNPSPENKNNLEQVKDDLESFIERKVQGNLIRARVEQIEEGEKSTQQFFLAMEKQNHVRKHMKKVVSGNRITEDPDEILLEQKQFYRKLYESRHLKMDSSYAQYFFENFQIPKISQ